MTTRQKQSLLVFYGLLQPGDIDGIWGAQSAEATKKLQSQLGLEADGIWGKATDAAVRKAISEGKTLDVSTSETTGQIGTFWDEIEYFCRDEFRCTCGKCGGFPVEPEETMVRVVDEIRRRAGVPIAIVDSGGSGIRCAAHNAKVGGVANSEHLHGKAADLHSRLAPSQLKEIAEAVTAERIPGRGGIGLYSWGIHVDTGKYSRWNG